MITFEGRNIVVRHLYILYFITFTAKLRPQHESSPLSLGEGSGGRGFISFNDEKTLDYTDDRNGHDSHCWTFCF